MIVTLTAVRVAEVVLPIFKFFEAGPYRQNEKNKPATQRESTFLCEVLSKMCVLIQGLSRRKKAISNHFLFLSVGGTPGRHGYILPSEEGR